MSKPPQTRSFPLTSLPDVAQALQSVLTTFPEEAARLSGYTQRQSKLTAPLLTQTLVLGWLRHPQASLGQLTQMAARRGVRITPQGLDQRFTPATARLLRTVLETTVQKVVIQGDPVLIPLLQRFTAVVAQDSTTIALPAALKEQWRGCGGHDGQGEAALKLQVRLDLLRGQLTGPYLEPGRSQDRNCGLQHDVLEPGTLRLADLGYFSLGVLERLDQEGVYFLSHWQVQTALYDEAGRRLDLEALLQGTAAGRVERWVRMGARQRIRVRLLAERVPPEVAAERRRRLHAAAKKKGQPVSQKRLELADWTILVTNVPEELLSSTEALSLIRARWQIELLFKLWKQQGLVDEWRSGKPWRILCEVYAKLIGVVLQHGMLLSGWWRAPDKSMVQAVQSVRDTAPALAGALGSLWRLTQLLRDLARTLQLGCRMNPRRKHPNTYQLLLAVEPAESAA